MPVKAENRPLNVLRDDVIDELIANYGHGKLSLNEFERRLDSALDAKDAVSLLELTSDLDKSINSPDMETRPQPGGRVLHQSEARAASHHVDYTVNIFGGGSKRGVWPVPAEIRMINVFGGGDLDFTDACFSQQEVRVKLFSLFGGGNIFVPEHANVSSRAICIFGGISDKGAGEPYPEAPHIIIEGFVLFGGCTIKVRKTFKQRVVEFADNFRGILSSPDQLNLRR